MSALSTTSASALKAAAMRGDYDTRKAMISVTGALVNLFIAIILIIALLYLVLVLIMGVEGIGSLQRYASDFRDVMSAFSNIMISILIIVGAALILAFLLILVCWLCRNENEGGIMVLPFEVAIGKEKYSGKAIAYLLTAELKRIEQINKIEIPQIHEPLGAPIKGSISVELSSYLPSIAITSGNLPYSLPNLGTVSLGNNSISLDQLLLTLKILWPLGETGQIITGALQKYGSTTNLVAFLEHRDIRRSWEISGEIYDKNIPDLVRDVSYKIFFDLMPKNRIESWVTLRYFTESMYYYHQYRTTKNIIELERAGDNCLKALETELYYDMLNKLSNELGFSWYIQGNDNLIMGKLKEAKECYYKALRFGAWRGYDETTRTYHGLGQEYLSNLYHNYGHVLMLMGEIKGAMRFHNSAVKCNSNNAYAWNDKGTVHRIMGENEKAIKCYKEAIKIRPIFSTAYISLAAVYRILGREDERIETCKKARDFLTKPGDEYNSACFEAVCGSPNAAIGLLRTALEIKPYMANWARQDPDFEFIRDETRFSALLDEFS